MTWADIMPSLKQLDVVVGTPVRIRPGHEPSGWVSKCLTVDLEHPLGFAAALLILKKLHPSKGSFDTMTKLRNAWLFGPNDEDRRILSLSLVRHLNQTHREV